MDEGTRIGDGARLTRARRPFSPRVFAVGLALAVAAIAVVSWRDNRTFYDPANLLSRFPAEDGTALSIDFQSLRAAGLLTPSKSATEAEYRQFVDGTGFDYRRDLDQVYASLSKSGNYFIARGRFDWKRLRDYAAKEGGSCYQELCRVQGSTPLRHISFLPLRVDTMALAVSTDDLAAARLTKTGTPSASRLPTAPVWVSVPGPVLRQRDSLPPGLRLVLSSLGTADRVVITVAQEAGGIEARLDASCRTDADASMLAGQLRTTTGMLKQAIVTDREAGQDELARALAAGVFDVSGVRVSGKWPVSRGLIDSVTAGI